VGILLGTAPRWFNDRSPVWPAKHSDEAQWVLEQLMMPGFAFVALVGRGSQAFKTMIAFNVVFFGLMVYSFLQKPNTDLKPSPTPHS
jgi:hypothetical protein